MRAHVPDSAGGAAWGWCTCWVGWLKRLISVLGTLSCQEMWWIRRRQRRWKVLNFLSCWAQVVQVLLPCSSVLRTQALYTAIFVFVESLRFSQTRVVRRASVVAAFPIRLLSSTSIQRQVVRDGWPKVGKLVDSFQLVIINGGLCWERHQRPGPWPWSSLG